MNEDAKNFLSEIRSLLKKHFKEFSIEILLETPKSLKVNVYLVKDIFIAIRHNLRNERTDFALIHNSQRTFGYDNLKKWHYHPYENPSEHIPCDKPSLDKIIADIKKVYEAVRYHA